jgi:hypothetical protein
MALTSGQLAKKCEVGVEALRFFEREGLLAKPARRVGLPSGLPPSGECTSRITAGGAPRSASAGPAGA